MSYDDPKWREMLGGYKIPYDPTPALKKLESGDDMDGAWEELWNELYHQGDLGEASYAVVPHLVRIHKENRNLDWNLYGFVSTVEIERKKIDNPAIPGWLEATYASALKDLLNVALYDLMQSDDSLTVRLILAFIVLAKGYRKFGALISDFDEDELDEVFEEYLGWSELYGD